MLDKLIKSGVRSSVGIECTTMADAMVAMGMMMGIKTFTDVRRRHRQPPRPTSGSALYASEDEEGDENADEDAAPPSFSRFTGKTREPLRQEVEPNDKRSTLLRNLSAFF
jgi:hypothetical protein